MGKKKPTGTTGHFRAAVLPEGQTAGDFVKVQFPHGKEEIEKFVFDRYVQAMNSGGSPLLTNITQNPENHFDFTVTIPDGSEHYFDLAEFVLKARNGSPYAEVGGLISHRDVADQLLTLVRNKSDHYAKPGAIPIGLLVYVTHYRFSPSEEAIRLVQHGLKTSPPIMQTVQFVTFRSQDVVHPRMLHPVDGDPLEGHAPETFQDRMYMKLDPSAFELISNPPNEV
ncbi:hypothetical protein ACVME8_004162 [Bradyrhizobium diazoefficiens]